MDNNHTVDMSCVIEMDRSCELCLRKVTEVMHCVNGVYSVDFGGGVNSMKLEGRVNPDILLAVIERYSEHGKITNLRFNGELVYPRGGGCCDQSGYYLPSTVSAGGYYPYPSPYLLPPLYAFAGNYVHPTSNPPWMTDQAPRNPHIQHNNTAVLYSTDATRRRTLHSYAYVEQQQYRTSSSGGGRYVRDHMMPCDSLSR